MASLNLFVLHSIGSRIGVKGWWLLSRILFHVKLKMFCCQAFNQCLLGVAKEVLISTKRSVNPNNVVLFPAQEAWPAHAKTYLLIRPVGSMDANDWLLVENASQLLGNMRRNGFI